MAGLQASVNVFQLRFAREASIKEAGELFKKALDPQPHDSVREGEVHHGAQRSASATVVSEIDNTEYKYALQYKGRYMVTSPALHVAIWLETMFPEKWPSLVKTLVLSGCSLDGRSTYYTDTHEVKLHAVVIAAGLGNHQVVEALTTNMPDLPAFLNSRDLCTSSGDYYYAPLHEACFQGQTETVCWLLKNGSNPQMPDLHGVPPLHAFVVAGSYDNENDKIKNAVETLIRSKAPLSLKAQIHSRADQHKCTPLELVTQSDSNFPKEFQYLLSPAYQLLVTNGDANTDTNPSFIDDLLSLAGRSTQSANSLARQLLEKVVALEQDVASKIHEQLQLDVQVDVHAPRKLADIMYAAPQAAADILEVLMQDPKLQDPSHCPLRSRTRFWGPLGPLQNKTMRCEYRTDALPAENQVIEPTWFFDAHQRANGEPSWHKTFLPIADDVRDRASTYDAKVEVLMVPNILGINMMQALSEIWDTKVLNRASVAGLEHGMWSMMGTLNIAKVLGLIFFEIGPLLYWGLSMGADGVPLGRLGNMTAAPARLLNRNSPSTAPFCWPTLAGVFIKECVEHAVLIWDHVHRCRRSAENPSYTGMWKRRILLSADGPAFHILLTLLLGWLLWQTAGFNGCGESQTLCFNVQGELSANLAWRLVKLLYMARTFTGCGEHIISIVDSFASGANVEMIVIMCATFLAFLSVNLSLRRNHGFAWEATYLYRALIFGDGNGLTDFGINSGDGDDEGDPQQHHWTTFYGIISTLLFNVTFLNLMIAIYSDEYKTRQEESNKSFRQSRAKVMVNLMQTYHRIGSVCTKARELWFAVALFIPWAIAQYVAMKETEYVTCFPCAILFAAWQLALLTFLSYWGIVPYHHDLRKQGVDCTVERVVRVERHAVELKIKVQCRGFEAPAWEKYMTTRSSISSYRKIWGGLDVQKTAPKPPIDVCDAKLENKYFKASLRFEPVRCMSQIMTFDFETPDGSHGMVEFLLPRFLWICYRQDGIFDERVQPTRTPLHDEADGGAKPDIPLARDD